MSRDDPWANTALRKAKQVNGGHRYGLQSDSDIYSYADEVRTDPYSGEAIWFCDRGDYVELKRKLPGWGILIDFQSGMTLEKFRKLEEHDR